MRQCHCSAESEEDPSRLPLAGSHGTHEWLCHACSLLGLVRPQFEEEGQRWQGSGLRSGCWRRRRLFCRGGWWCSSSRPSGRGQGGGRGWLCPRIWFVVRCLCDRCFGQFRAWKMGSGGRRGVRHAVAGLCRTFLQTGLWQVFRTSRRWGLFGDYSQRLHAGLICVAPPFESAAGGASG